MVLKALNYLLFNHVMGLLALDVSLNAVPMNGLESVIIFIVFIVSLCLTVNKGLSVDDTRCFDQLNNLKKFTERRLIVEEFTS